MSQRFRRFGLTGIAALAAAAGFCCVLLAPVHAQESSEKDPVKDSGKKDDDKKNDRRSRDDRGSSNSLQGNGNNTGTNSREDRRAAREARRNKKGEGETTNSGEAGAQGEAAKGGGQDPGTKPPEGGGGGHSGGSSNGGGASAGLGEFNIVANPNNVMLRLTPGEVPTAQDLDAIEGSSFTTDLNLINKGSRPVDKVRVVLNYNPLFVTPVSINDSLLSGLTDGKTTAKVDRKLGQIIYEAALTKPLTNFSDPLLFIKWNALKPVQHTPIDFGTSLTGAVTELFSAGKPVLGEPQEEGDGVLSMGVRVLSSNPAEAELMKENPQLYVGSDERVGDVSLRIIGPDAAPRVGEVFTMDVVLDNRAYSRMDGVSLMIRFDSDVIEVLDADRDNWITLGCNLQDGSFREQFPFDYFIANTVYPSQGVMEYRVGASNAEEFQGSYGTIARIVARAHKPTTSTTVRFLFAKSPGMRTTEVTYLGQDVLGTTKDHTDGTKGAAFAVRP